MTRGDAEGFEEERNRSPNLPPNNNMKAMVRDKRPRGVDRVIDD